MDGSARYWAKRKAGISVFRKDGSKRSPETDDESAAAERYAADYMGCEFNDEVYETHGDGGYDFILPVKIEVCWAGDRDNGHLIINPNEPHRWADVYVVLTGTRAKGFVWRGWMNHNRLVEEPMKDFKYGAKFAMHFEDLYHIDRLMTLKMGR